MILESNVQHSDTDSFRVPCAAVDSLLASGCPTYLAVYLYALRQYHNGNTTISNAAIADALKISIIDVVNAFLFYNSQGLIKIHRFTSVDDGDFDIEFCSEGGGSKGPIPFRPSYKSSEISRCLRENTRMSQMYKLISQIMGKTLSSADTELLYSLYDYYALPVEVIVVLIDYYVSKGKHSMKYMEKEAGKWASAGIDTVEKANAYIKKREDFLSYTNRVRSLLGIQERRLTTRELGFINCWQNEFAMSLDMVKTAYELTVNQTGKLSFAYMNKILESWAQNNIHDPQAAAAKQPKKQEAPKKAARYDFNALEKQAFEAVNKPEGRRGYGV